MWHLKACKVSVSLSFLKWNDFYRISELMLITLNQRYDKIISVLLQFKNERLTEISDATFYGCINTIYQFIKPFLDKECLFLRNMEPFVLLYLDMENTLPL